MSVKKPEVRKTTVERPEPVKLSADEVRKRMRGFDTHRRDNFISSVREGGHAAAKPSDSGHFNR